MITTSIDTRGLESMLNGVKDALVGSGGDASELVKDESRLLSMQMMKLSYPKDRKKLSKKIENSVSSKFDSFAEQTVEGNWSNKQSSSGVTWFNVDRNFLFGFDPGVKDMRKSTAQQMADTYYNSGSYRKKKGTKVEFKYPRNHQRVFIVKSILSSPAAIKRGANQVKLAIGKLAASWFATAKQIDGSVSAPNWVARHLNGNKTTKSITDLTGLKNFENPYSIFGSRAKAAATKKGKEKIKFAIKIREKKLAARLKLILSGYSTDVANGIKAQRHARKTKGIE